MELVTASDLVVTASLALLLSFLVAKLVSFAVPTDPHTTTPTTTNQLNHLRHVSGEPLTVQTESKVQFQLPTNIETDHNKEEEVKEETKVEPDAVELSVTPDIAVEVSDETQEFDPEAVGSADLDDSVAEQRKTDCDSIEEISVEKPSSVEEERDVVLDDDDDDWEGIERSELEKEFMAATEFVVGNGSKSVGNDVEMELYGLHKVATEGPCRHSQPMPLMLSARAKWNAWQKLGNMSPEVAMEQYISLVSDKVPGWMKDTSAGIREHEPAGSEISESVSADLSTSLSHQQIMLTDRELEQEKESSAQDHSPLTESDLENNNAEGDALNVSPGKSSDGAKEHEKKQKDEQNSSADLRGKQQVKQAKENSQSGEAPKDNFIHERARRGQATNSHSLAERVRREKINERMRLLQELVPGCNKITGKAAKLDEIIFHVQSLQKQVEFLAPAKHATKHAQGEAKQAHTSTPCTPSSQAAATSSSHPTANRAPNFI